MNFILSFLTFSTIVFANAQQNDKGNSMIPFPRIGRADPRFFMEGKRNGNSLSPGLIPFPRIGRSGSDGIHEMKRQLIPFPRVGKRPYWRVPMEPYPAEFEDYTFPLMDPAAFPSSSDFAGIEENETEKRNAANTGSNNNNGMWFGPRLGKRKKRSIEAETSGERGHDSMDTQTLIKILHNFNWAIVPIKERRTFTPRLGRSSDEASGGIHHRSEPYTPRLGRSREVVSPDFDGEDDQDHGQISRFSRNGSSGNKNQGKPKSQSEDTNVGVPFSPRLGRDHINPRLGRSSEE